MMCLQPECSHRQVELKHEVSCSKIVADRAPRLLLQKVRHCISHSHAKVTTLRGPRIHLKHNLWIISFGPSDLQLGRSASGKSLGAAVHYKHVGGYSYDSFDGADLQEFSTDAGPIGTVNGSTVHLVVGTELTISEPRAECYIPSRSSLAQDNTSQWRKTTRSDQCSSGCESPCQEAPHGMRSLSRSSEISETTQLKVKRQSSPAVGE
mmetsp:Transcript_118541/g.228757  ORF Transcript_118541/g.228757 Transcript_118541/m.228757 type:complete len:208 (+) Transcript_118541:184-807(+)